MPNLTTEQLKEMSVDDLLNLRPDEIPALAEFVNLPRGIYSGVLRAVHIPDPAEKREFYESVITPTAVMELVDEADEATAAGIVEAGEPVKTRWFPGIGVQKFVKAFTTVFDAVAPGEPLGVFFATVNQEGYELPVTFQVDHRADKADKTKVYMDVKVVNPA